MARHRASKRQPEALIALLHDRDASTADLTPIAARWAAAVPTTVFLALEGIADLCASSVDPYVQQPLQATSGSEELDVAAQVLEGLLERQLRSHGVDVMRLVLVGFGYGGTLALHLSLHRGWRCGGVLAFSGDVVLPLPRVLRIDNKVRLIDYSAKARFGCASLRELVALLTNRGIDARGVVLSSSAFSDEVIRYGASYLVELVATAQRNDPLHVRQEEKYA